MKNRHAFRPEAVIGLEDRQLLSRSGLTEAVLPAATAHAAVRARNPAVALGAVGTLGDSFTDEYRFYSPDRSRARNWVEILSATRRINFGRYSNASRGEPRNAGFAYNWARSDATTVDMI